MDVRIISLHPVLSGGQPEAASVPVDDPPGPEYVGRWEMGDDVRTGQTDGSIYYSLPLVHRPKGALLVC